jgi:hypothetical protein
MNIIGDPGNPTRHGLFLTDTNVDGIADGFGTAIQGAGAGDCTATLEDVAGVPGKMQQLDQAVSGNSQLTWTGVNLNGFAPGDKVAFMCRLQAEAEAGSLEYSIGITLVNATANPTQIYPVNGWRRDLEDGIVYFEFDTPASTARFDLQFVVVEGTGTVRIGQMCLRNLTALGIA